MASVSIHNLLLSISENADVKAFEEVYLRYYPGLFSYTNSLLNDKQGSQEVVSDVFTKIWENRHMLPSIQNFPQYLYTSAKNTSINYLKKNKRNLSFEAGELSSFTLKTPELSIINKENLGEIISAINALPPKCRLIFRLVKEDGLSYSAVSELLNVSPRTVNAQMTIAICRIVEALQHSLPEFRSYFLKRKIK